MAIPPGLGAPLRRVVVLSGLLGFVWKIRDYLSLFLRQDSGEGLVPALARNLELAPLIGWGLSFALVGGLAALGLGWAHSRLDGGSFERSLAEAARAWIALLVPVGLVLACAFSLAISPDFPYVINLAVSLAMEGSFLSLLTAGLLLAALVRELAFEAAPPKEARSRRFTGLAVVLAALVAFVLATPARFYDEGVGQGNMFKYLRMASAAAGSGTLDIRRADTDPEPTPAELVGHFPRLAGSYLRETAVLFGNILDAASEGRLYRGEPTASRANRSMFRAADGGIYYINAPGPGLLLVPAYLLDRRLEAWLGWEKQIAVVLFWQLLGALLVHQIFLAAAEIGDRLSAVLVALGVGLSVPVLFYTFQVYPELPGGLALVFAFRKLVLDPAPSSGGVFAAGLALALAPWLHQKYSVVSAVLAIYAGYRLLERAPAMVVHPKAKVALLLAPMALSAYSIFLYNHALTGSLSPTATFTAAGRSSFEPQGFPKGFLGLLLDRENGLFVYAPFYLLALVGWSAFAERHRRLVRPLLLVVGSYMLVIASFPYWPGAVSTMGRYILSILPFLALPAVLVVRRALVDGIVAGVVVVLAAASFAYTASFVRDLVPSYQPMLLWNRMLFSDPGQYLPTFLSDGVLGSGPAHYPKLLAALLVIGTLVYALRDRVRQQPLTASDVDRSRYPRRLAAGASGLLLLVLVVAALLERWPGNAPEAAKPTYRDLLTLGRGATLSVRGEHGIEGRGFWVAGGGTSQILVTSTESLSGLSVRLTAGPEGNQVVVRERGSAPIEMAVPPGGPHRSRFLLRKPYRFEGPRGERFLYRVEIDAEESFVPAETGESDDHRELGVYVEAGR